MATARLLLAALLVVVVVAGPAAALTTQIEPKSQQCYNTEMRAGEVRSVLFRVTRGGLLDIRVKITGPDPNMESSELMFFNEGGHEGEAVRTISANQGGTYTVCFDNTMSRFTSKVVSFRFTEERPGYKPNPMEGAVRDEHLNPMERSIDLIGRSLDEIEREQEAYRVREQQHRDLTERLLSRANLLAMIEATVIILWSLFHVMILRRLFNPPREGERRNALEEAFAACFNRASRFLRKEPSMDAIYRAR